MSQASFHPEPRPSFSSSRLSSLRPRRHHCLSRHAALARRRSAPLCARKCVSIGVSLITSRIFAATCGTGGSTICRLIRSLPSLSCTTATHHGEPCYSGHDLPGRVPVHTAKKSNPQLSTTMSWNLVDELQLRRPPQCSPTPRRVSQRVQPWEHWNSLNLHDLNNGGIDHLVEE